ncbi:sortase [Patescibacteria group bacterium]|jgi:sortase (surface protein transpeptidase)|nr:sortase [Patescibacteria group bacterium]
MSSNANNRIVPHALKAALPGGLMVFSLLTVVLAQLDLLPEPTTAAADESANAAAVTEAAEAVLERTEEPAEEPAAAPEPVALPERIRIDALGIDVAIENPTSTEVAVLDEALLAGAVRYPSSAQLGEAGNVFLFGHSSSLPVVRNQNFKAFNGLSTLVAGDLIQVDGGGQRHLYRVETVRLARADEALVSFDRQEGRRLTLSTCNTFGEKDERWVVEATFVGAYPITG